MFYTFYCSIIKMKAMWNVKLNKIRSLPSICFRSSNSQVLRNGSGTSKCLYCCYRAPQAQSCFPASMVQGGSKLVGRERKSLTLTLMLRHIHVTPTCCQISTFFYFESQFQMRKKLPLLCLSSTLFCKNTCQAF